MKSVVIASIVGLVILLVALAVILQNLLIVSALISLAVSLVVLGLDKLLLTPKARKRAYELRDLEKRLDVLGELVALLRATGKKANAFWRESQTPDAKRLSHYIEQHDLKALDCLFGEKARLMPPKLADLWTDQLRQDIGHTIDEKRNRTLSSIEEEWRIPNFVLLELSEMQQLAESNYKEMVDRWGKLAEIKLDSPYSLNSFGATRSS